jgi:hypothetical protein
MTTSEPKVAAELVPLEGVIQRLHASGLPAHLVAEASGQPLTVVQTVLRRRVTTPQDDELEAAWALVERDALRFIRRTYRFGTQADKMSLTKIIAGRMLAKRANVDNIAVEEARMTWMEIREEQRAAAQPLDNLAHFPTQLDQDDDYDD